LLAASPPLVAAPLTFDGALALAESSAPSLRAQDDSIESARSSAVAAGRLPDPRLFAGIENLPVSGPPRWTLDEEPMTMARVGLMQEIPNAARRRAEKELAAAGIARAEAGRAIERQRVRRETAVAWIRRYHLERKGALLDDFERENRLLAEGVNARIAAGEASAPEAVLPKQEAAMLAERRDELAAEVARSVAALRRWLGEAAEAPLAFPIEHGHLRHRLQSHPELAAFASMSAEAEAEVHAADAMKSPDWGVELAYGRRDPDFGDMVSLQVSIDLPLFPSRRQDPLIAASQARLHRIEAERETMLREHGEELEIQVADHERLQRALRRQQETFVPLAREKVDLTLAAYGAGETGLDAVLAARRELVESRWRAIGLESELAQLEARLHYAYGEEGR
jgi:outer membrane protein TolC